MDKSPPHNSEAEKRRSRLLPEGAIIEMVKYGIYVKISAIDPHTGEEVYILGDPKASHSYLSELAIRKLEAKLEAKRPQPLSHYLGSTSGKSGNYL